MYINMYIEMELLSDAMPDSGMISTGIADAEIPYDEYGIPYIPAKRIKGILRDSAEQLCDINILKEKDVYNIFGKNGEGINYNFIISDGIIENGEKIRKLLKYFEEKDDKNINNFNRNNVINLYSYLRVQIKIDEETGVAKDKNLRVFRVLNKGLKFYFNISINNEFKEILIKILKITRNFGSNRTRGMGEIKLTLIEGNKIKTVGNKEKDLKNKKIDTFPKENINVLSLTIKTVSQLIVATKTGFINESNDYIPGKFIIGELAYRYIKKYNLKNAHEDDNFRRIFLSDETIFENGYPVVGKEKFYPSPLSIVKEKDKNKEFYDLLNENDLKKMKDANIITKGGLKTFSVIKENGETYEKITPKSIEFHHRRPNDRAYGSPNQYDGEFYSYVSINKGEMFNFEIRGNESDIKNIYLLLFEDKKIHLGKSKNSQYGSCVIENIEIFSKKDEEVKWKKGNNLYITLLSDMLLRNENGFYTNDVTFFVNEFKEKIGEKNIEFCKIINRISKISGFSGIMKMPTIKLQGLKAGSEIVLKNSSNRDILINFSEGYFGDMINEGYGKIRICNSRKKINLVELQIKENLDINKEEIDLKLIEKILLNKLKNSMLNKIEIKENPNYSTFISKLLLMNREAKSVDELIENMKKFKERTKKKLNTIIQDIFLLKNGNKNSEEFLAYIEEINDQIIKNQPKILDILKIANKEKNFYFKDKIDELYKFYLEKYLTTYKFKIRRKKNNEKEN